MAEVLVKSVKKALDALDYIMKEKSKGQGVSLSDIAGFLDEKLPTARNILKTMETCGYVSRNGKLYVAGAKIYNLFRAEIRKQLIDTATPYLSSAAVETGESFVLTTILEGKREVLCRIQGSNEVGVNLGVAEYKTDYSLVTTRIILAYANEIDKANYIEQHGLPKDEWPEAKNGKFEACLEDLKTAGFAAERNNSFCAYAFPIRNANGELLGALGVYVPAFRIDQNAEFKLLKTLEEISNRIKHDFDK